jgi:hypothetical protein
MAEKILFLQAVLTPESVEKLKTKFPPHHAKVACHHVTLAFKPTAEEVEKLKADIAEFGAARRIVVDGYRRDTKGEAVTVLSMDAGLPVIRPTQKFHVTISTAEGISPVYSNELLAGSVPMVRDPFVLDVVLDSHPLGLL